MATGATSENSLSSQTARALASRNDAHAHFPRHLTYRLSRPAGQQQQVQPEPRGTSALAPHRKRVLRMLRQAADGSARQGSPFGRRPACAGRGHAGGRRPVGGIERGRSADLRARGERKKHISKCRGWWGLQEAAAPGAQSGPRRSEIFSGTRGDAAKPSQANTASIISSELRAPIASSTACRRPESDRVCRSSAGTSSELVNAPSR